MLIFICFIVLIQAYVLTWLIPTYTLLTHNAAAVTPDLTKGYAYVIGLVVILVALAAGILLFVKKKEKLINLGAVTSQKN